MSEELEKIDNVEQSTGEVSGEVTEPEDNSAEIEAEQERLRREHEEFLNSFPETTVFYRDLLDEGSIKKLGMATKDPHVADYYKILDNHFDESELTYIGTPECGTYYLKGYEKPEPSEIEKMKAYAKMIELQVDKHLQELCDSKGYDDVKSCVGYFNSTDEIFSRDAKAMNVYRDHLYRTCYDIINQCEKGEIDYRVVTLEYILSLIDPIEW